MNWDDVKRRALAELMYRELSDSHKDRLLFEISEIEKQGSESLWIGYLNKRFDKNPNNLILPWLLGLMVGEADADPLLHRETPILNAIRASKVKEYAAQYGHIPHDFLKDQDLPDIDLDCLPGSRDPIKQYAMEKYGKDIADGYGPVCGVGTWQTYKFKSAIIDVCAAMGIDKKIAHGLTTDLPADVDDLKENGFAACKGKVVNDDGTSSECGCFHDRLKCPQCGSEDTSSPTIAKICEEYEILRNFMTDHPAVVEYAIRIIGRIRNMGMHSGALIIADRTLYGNIPMAKSGSKGYWISMWSEGRNTQLSKLGWLKWDILGLKTLEYIYNCCAMIEKNRGMYFGEKTQDDVPAMSGWEYINPQEHVAGYFYDKNGERHVVDLRDERSIKLAHDRKTDGVFQFDTPLAMRILENGVKRFEDLLFYMAAGHPGPMQCCWSYSKINTDEGLVSIRDLPVKKPRIACLDTSQNLVYTRQYAVIPSGKKKLLQIKLKDGRTIKVSHDHKILTSHGYVKADQLKPSDRIVCAEGAKNT